MINEKEIFCFYHDNCPDGFCCAWLVHRYLGDNLVEYIPCQYDNIDTIIGKYESRMVGKDIYILDFSFPVEITARLINSAKKLVMLDHHKTAKENFEKLANYALNIDNNIIQFDMEQCGAMLTLNYFRETFPTGYGVSNEYWLVPYVQDHDLWQHKLPHSHEIHAALVSYPFDFKIWDNFTKQQAYHDFIREGIGICRYKNNLVDRICKEAREAFVQGHKVFIVNTPILQSEVANKLSQQRPFAMTYYYTHDKMHASLRSSEHGIDVSEIAKVFGGGGHKHAAGFTKVLSEFIGGLQ